MLQSDIGFQLKKKVVNEIPGVLTNEKLRSDKIKKFNNLNSKYTFNNFIVGGNNEFAKTAADAVSKNPGEQNFNPLIIYGGVGLGKTHLMHAIGNKALENYPDLNIVNITSEQFTLDFCKQSQKKQNHRICPKL